jgi:hypothetical protein
MPILTTIATTLTLANLVECIINGSFENAPSVAIKGIPKLAERLKKQFSDTKPEVNGDLQKAILSAHWMATIVFVEQMHKKGLLKDSYNNVNQTIKKELKEFQKKNSHPEEISVEVYNVTPLLKLSNEEKVIEKLEADLLDFHLKLLDKKTGDVKKQEDYKNLKDLIQNGWKEENLNWFQLMTAFLNQLLKGDNNKAKDAFQNQTLAEINQKLDDYAEMCIQGIGVEKFEGYKVLLNEEIEVLKNWLCEIHKDVISIKKTGEATFTKVEQIEADVIEIKNSLGNSRQLNLNVFEQYRTLLDDINVLKEAFLEIEKEKKETLELINEEQDKKKKRRFERDYDANEKELLETGYEIEQKQKELKEFTSNIEKTWLSVYSENSPRLNEARAALEMGDLEKANSILNPDAMQHDFDILEKLDTAILEKKGSLAQEYMTKANLVVTQKTAKEWFELADEYYSKSVTLLENYKACYLHAFFLSDHHQMKRALILYKKALPHCSNDLEKANVLNNLASILNGFLEFSEAKKRYIEALEIYRELSVSKSDMYRFEVAGVLNSLGRLYSTLREIKKSKQSFEEAIEIYKELIIEGYIECKYNLAVALNNVGEFYFKLPDFDKALERYKEALEINRSLKDTTSANVGHMCKVLNNLGVIYYCNNRFKKSEISHLEALDIRQKLTEFSPKVYQLDLASTLINIAALYLNGISDQKKSLAKSLEGYLLARPFNKEVPISNEYCMNAKQIWSAWGKDLEKHLEGLDSVLPDS